jgi:hypothetical protein
MLKAAIRTKLGIETQNQRLVFAGKELDDGKTLHSYSISDGSTIHVCGYLLSLPQPVRSGFLALL